MVAAARADGAQAASSYIVDVRGGRLTVATRVDGHVELTGPAVIVASGELAESFLA
jgi:diaminopimelate epimerase